MIYLPLYDMSFLIGRLIDEIVIKPLSLIYKCCFNAG